ncbi:MAG: peptidyl-prolyl cis-trans isomerase [Anaerolineaceae bacterium]|nr:MAG: peptidyl-prolyl cis-trans isomerase [Anaerolineaceae bacterium]
MSIESVQANAVVSIEYALKVDGKLLDSSVGEGPLWFLAGYDNIVPGLEAELIGMKVGDSKNVVVQPEDGYGEFDEEAFMQIPRSEFPEHIPLEIGEELNVSDNEDNSRLARIESMDDELITLNFNHPLAGAELHFYVKVVALREPTAEELEHGHAHEDGAHHD